MAMARWAMRARGRVGAKAATVANAPMLPTTILARAMARGTPRVELGMEMVASRRQKLGDAYDEEVSLLARVVEGTALHDRAQCYQRMWWAVWVDGDVVLGMGVKVRVGGHEEGETERMWICGSS